MPTQYSTTTSGTNAVGYSTMISIDDAIAAVKLVKNEGDIHPQLYFKWAKSKFKPLEKLQLAQRERALTKAFDKAAENGQDMLARKILSAVLRETREAALHAKGVKWYVSRAELSKYKRRIRGGHISDTQFSEFTREIPARVLKRKKELDGMFDGYVIYHYWSDARGDGKGMPAEERAKMRDPVLFGYFKQKADRITGETSIYVSSEPDSGELDPSDRLYFIADWEDEKCDLTFDEMIEGMGSDRNDQRIATGDPFADL